NGRVSAVGIAAWCGLRRRWRQVVLLILLVGVVGAAALATGAGGRRASTALARFKSSSRSADIELAAEATPEQLDELARVPGVAAVAALGAFGLTIPDHAQFQSIGVPMDAAFGTTVDRDRIVAGRPPDPSSVDEITLGEGLATELGLAVGGHLTVESFTPAQVAAILGGAGDVGEPSGPRVDLRVAAIVRRPLDLGDRGASGGLLMLTPAFGRAYTDRIGVFGIRIRIRTDHGVADVPRVLTASRAILGDTLSAQSLAVGTQGARAAIDLFASALWICAGVAAVAGAIAIAIVTARELQLIRDEHERLRELGCTRRQLVMMGMVPTVLGAVGGGVLAVVAALALSPLFPLGVARRADPDVGLHADWTVLAVGAVALVGVVVAMGFVAAFLSTSRRSLDRSGAGRSWPSTLAERVAAAGMAPPLTNGVRMAVGSDRRGAPIRPALFGAVVGTLGLTAALLFGASVRHLVATPRLYGANWDFSAADVTANTPCGGSDYGLAAEPGIAALAELCSQNVQLDGRPATAIAYTQLRGGPIAPVVVSGQAPDGPNEVALGATTLRMLGKHAGDTVHVAGRSTTLEYRIVGTVVFPSLAQAQPLADGAAFTGAGYAPLFDQNLFTRAFVGRIAPGADRSALERRISATPQLAPPVGPAVPTEVGRLHEIRWLPVTLAILVASLALLAVGHALVTGVRRHRRELAILKTLGFTRSQVRATVAWQATTMGTVGLVIGIPIGIVVGELLWRRVASDLGVSTNAPFPTATVLLIVPAVIALVNLVALLPARAAAQAQPAAALRTD
ncbi:MAG: putative transport system permease protein, partial [Frankiaceae bacterium]|nr:putative transport system permease protein [Frankiaceae bacterium]